MKKLKFSVETSATKEKLWDALWEDKNYREWTSAFNEGSQVKTDNWKKDSRVLFLGAGGDEGMVSRVAENEPYKTMSFEHLGIVKDGVEDTESEAVKIWSGSRENYFITETENGTRLNIETDTPDDYIEYFEKAWPLALDKLKAIAEQ